MMRHKINKTNRWTKSQHEKLYRVPNETNMAIHNDLTKTGAKVQAYIRHNIKANWKQVTRQETEQ